MRQRSFLSRVTRAEQCACGLEDLALGIWWERLSVFAIFVVVPGGQFPPQTYWVQTDIGKCPA